MSEARDGASLPLEGVRVVEMGSLLAGPFCGQLLGDFGAEVIKVEPPGKGDPMREWGRHRKEDRTLWWPVIARNKKSVTLNLREKRARSLHAGSSPGRTYWSRTSGPARWSAGGSGTRS